MSRRHRYWAGLAVATVCIGAGIVLELLTVFAASAVGLTYAAYASLGDAPASSLAVERTVTPTQPRPGESVSVRLTVRNEGSTVLPDVRVADSPPDGLVVDGSTRAGVSLSPGETETIEYAVTARRGSYEFGEVTARSATVSGGAAVVETYPIESEIDCADLVETVPIGGETIQYTGRIDGEAGGEGVEFHAIRAHQPTDPMNRIDWTRLARTGELATIEFRQEQAVRVVCLVDARSAAASRRRAGEATAIELSRRGVRHLATRLLVENNQVGVAWFGGSGHYLRPCSGRPQRARIRRFLDGEWDDTFGYSNWLSAGADDVDRCCRHLADEKQIVLFSPLLDDGPVEAARRFAAFGHDVTVVSPSVVPDSLGGTVQTVVRDDRISTLRSAGVRVVAWSPTESLHVALDRASRGWSA
ncbi:DUF58 domain-containing protein [Halovivax gelatinilyticus]|uniref:DUF58 domain-containing protein n=1 Tax=Halovivax gelatinilyticus TaxID=2961597 RepID=UPI0020CA9AF2|nr:DUF58 domain-containing protein [Halovivax gelatinilyticus]